jgi:hypothetical protein
MLIHIWLTSAAVYSPARLEALAAEDPSAYFSLVELMCRRKPRAGETVFWGIGMKMLQLPDLLVGQGNTQVLKGITEYRAMLWAWLSCTKMWSETLPTLTATAKAVAASGSSSGSSSSSDGGRGSSSSFANPGAVAEVPLSVEAGKHMYKLATLQDWLSHQVLSKQAGGLVAGMRGSDELYTLAQLLEGLLLMRDMQIGSIAPAPASLQLLFIAALGRALLRAAEKFAGLKPSAVISAADASEEEVSSTSLGDLWGLYTQELGEEEALEYVLGGKKVLECEEDPWQEVLLAQVNNNMQLLITWDRSLHGAATGFGRGEPVVCTAAQPASADDKGHNIHKKLLGVDKGVISGLPAAVVRQLVWFANKRGRRQLFKMTMPTAEDEQLSLLADMLSVLKVLVDEVPLYRCCNNPACGNLVGPLERELPGMKRCAGCGLAWYCGKACQKAHWHGGHKGACERLRALKEAAA